MITFTSQSTRRFYTLLSLTLLLSAFCLTNSQACVDPDTIATLNINYSEDFSEVEIRIGNLRLETEAPNIFCACGLASETEVFTYVTYIAVVYAGTNDVYPNFVPFSQSGPADDAWDESQPTIPNWNGYIAEVINDGLAADEAVEMIIRAEAPAGVLVELSDNPQDSSSALYTTTYLGTDMWDPVDESIAEDHQAVRTFGALQNITVNVESQEYFDDLDAALLTSTREVDQSPFTRVALAPNPVNQQSTLSFQLEKSTQLSVVIYDLTGAEIARLSNGQYSAGMHTIELPLGDLLPAKGCYIGQLQSPDGQQQFKLIKL